ncbi:Nodule Cysteine-Rich (NCR) secreted peptide [Medicago truncatula]|uniref:Nodule Cysteine-Rich (NCR) secreted peptide n=2 Tax=Medicago truncatula TaxID=3880 RepID=G7I5S5_MEDTR|nr:Nodule Cysteine-Rich (NCR) secreted peptide [Medicago truncatula]
MIFFLSLILVAHNCFLVAQNSDAYVPCITVADCPPNTWFKIYRCEKGICRYHKLWIV